MRASLTQAQQAHGSQQTAPGGAAEEDAGARRSLVDTFAARPAALLASTAVEHQPRSSTRATSVNIILEHTHGAVAEADAGDDGTVVALDKIPRSVSRRRTWTLVAAGAAGVVVAAITVGLLLYFMTGTAVRVAQLEIPQTFSASFVASSKFNDSISYSGQVFKDVDASGAWVLSLAAQRTLPNGLRQVWTVTDRRAHVQTFNDTLGSPKMVDSACVDPATMPPLQDLGALFASAAPVPADSPVTRYPLRAHCGGAARRFALQWGPMDVLGTNTFLLCTQDQDSRSAFIEGSEFIAHVFDVRAGITGSNAPVTIPKNHTTGAPMDCPRLAVPSALAAPITALTTLPTTHWLLPAAPHHDRQLAGAINCIFVAPVFSAADEYTSLLAPIVWASVSLRLGTKCTYRHYVGVNVAGGWDASSLPRQCTNYVNTLTGVSYVFAYSSAGLALMLSRYNNQCRFQAGSRFYLIGTMVGGTPFERSMAAVCPGSALQVYYSVLQYIGACTTSFTTGATAESVHMTRLNPSYVSSSLTWAELKEYVQSPGTTTGVMCGSSTSGLMSASNTFLDMLSDAVPIGGVPRDGVVPVSTCGLGLRMSTGSYSSSNYNPAITTFDLTCQNGDAFIDPTNSQKPCAWFSSMMSQ